MEVYMSYFGEVKLIDRATGRAADVTADGELKVFFEDTDLFDEGNSTETPLDASGVFEGAAVDTLGYAAISVAIQSNRGSTILGLAFQFSHNGTDWLWGKSVTFASGAKHFCITPMARYFRVRYQNGGTAQDTFHICTILKREFPGENQYTVIESEHLETHLGNHRICADYNLAVASSAVIDLLVRPGDSYMHVTFDIFASQGAIIDIYEGATISAVGTTQLTVNSNRVGIPAVNQRVYQAPTVDAVGLKLFSFLAGGARQAGIAERNHEIILNPNTNYLFRVTSRADNNDIDWGFSWYERSSV